MKDKLKALGFTLVGLSVGAASPFVLEYINGDVTFLELFSNLKGFVATLLVSITSTSGIILIAKSLLIGKANEYKNSVDTMVANNIISVEQANAIKELMDKGILKFEDLLNGYSKKIETLLEENKTLKNINQELLDKINAFFEVANQLTEGE